MVDITDDLHTHTHVKHQRRCLRFRIRHIEITPGPHRPTPTETGSARRTLANRKSRCKVVGLDFEAGVQNPK